MTNKKSIHIKIISGFYYFVGGLMIVFGALYMFASGWIRDIFKNNSNIQEMTTGLYILSGLFLLVIGLLEFLLAKKISAGSKIARIIAIVISAMGLIWAIFGIIYYGGLENMLFILFHSYFLWALVKKY